MTNIRMSSHIHTHHEPLWVFSFSGISDDVGQIIAENAYYKAEKRGFEPGYEEHDWIESERDVLTLTACLWPF
jgi:hypothetical protein